MTWQEALPFLALSVGGALAFLLCVWLTYKYEATPNPMRDRNVQKRNKRPRLH